MHRPDEQFVAICAGRLVPRACTAPRLFIPCGAWLFNVPSRAFTASHFLGGRGDLNPLIGRNTAVFCSGLPIPKGNRAMPLSHFFIFVLDALTVTGSLG